MGRGGQQLARRLPSPSRRHAALEDGEEHYGYGYGNVTVNNSYHYNVTNNYAPYSPSSTYNRYNANTGSYERYDPHTGTYSGYDAKTGTYGAYNPATGKYGARVLGLVRAGGIATVLAFLTFLVVSVRRERTT